MTLITSGRATGRQCPVCGSPDGACGAAHAQAEAVAVDAPVYAKGSNVRPADVIAKRTINGIHTQVVANSEEAEEQGWEIVRRLDGKPYHKKREAPEPVAPEAPEPVEPEPSEEDGTEDAGRKAYLKTLTKSELYDKAKALEVEGRSTMDRDALIAGIIAEE